ncbi:unnamed protein product [Gordionus sp. m RMFG-2023]
MSSNIRRKSYIITLEEDEEMPSSVYGRHHPRPPGTHVKFNAGETEWQASKIVRKLKKHMDVVIENFEKISKEHLLAKDDLYKALREEAEMFDHLEKIEDHFFNINIKDNVICSKYGFAKEKSKNKSFIEKMMMLLEKIFKESSSRDNERLMAFFLVQIKILFKEHEIFEEQLFKTIEKNEYLKSQMSFYENTNEKLMDINFKTKMDTKEMNKA